MTMSEKHTCLICGGQLGRLAGLAGDRTVFGCVRCRLRRLLPVPDQAELDRLYGRREYYTEDLAELHDDLVVGYDPEAPIIRLYRRHLEAIVSAAPPPGRLLEIGCARGVFLDLARRAGYQVSGVEQNGYAAAYAREKFGLEVAAARFDEYGAAGGHDVVVALDVIEHMPAPEDFLRQVSGMIRSGGLAVIGTPDSGSMLYRLAESLARASGGRMSYPLYRFYGRGIEHLSVFDRDNLSDLAAKYGLKTIRTYGYGIPVDNMVGLSGAYRFGLRLLAARPYEFVLLAVKG